jgi:hypothetical protein
VDSLGAVVGEHVLVLGAGGLDTMCALLRRGCAAVAELRLGRKPEAQSAEMIVAPRIASLAQARQALEQARRALLPTGRVVLRLASDVGDPLALAAARLLKREGFCMLRLRECGGNAVLTAELPLFASVRA